MGNNQISQNSGGMKMKVRRLVLGIGFLVAMAIAFVAGTWAQQTDRVVWHWPASVDPLIAAPKNHKLLFENDHIRVLEVTVPPGTTEPVHGHQWPSVFAIDAVQPKDRNHNLEGGDKPNRPEPKRDYEDSDWYHPECRVMGPQAPHQITNLDTFPMHFYRLEFKRVDGKSIESMTKYPNSD
jgi:predicted metal-dependent enzyme (double-stranded beta helix superfamily)